MKIKHYSFNHLLGSLIGSTLVTAALLAAFPISGMAQECVIRLEPLSPPGKVYPLFDWRLVNGGALPQTITYELDEDTVTMTIADGASVGVAPNQVRIVLTSAPSITARKEIAAWDKDQGETLIVATEDSNHGPISMTLSPNHSFTGLGTCSGGADTIVFRKMKLTFGWQMVDMYYLDIKYFWKMLSGKTVTFNWTGDSCGGFGEGCIAPLYPSSSPFIPIYNPAPSQYVIEPAAVSWGSNRIDVFGRGVDNDLAHKWWDGQWHPWESLGPGGVLASGPTVASWGANRLDVFARGVGNSLLHKWWDGSWHPWEALDGGVFSDPAAVSWAPGRIDVFWRGANNALQHKYFDNGWWSLQEDLGGTLTSGPAVATWGYNRLDVFARGRNNSLAHKSWDGSWHYWESLDGGVFSDPAAVSWSSGRIDVFWRGENNALRHKYFDNGWWSLQEDLGGEIVPLGQPMVPGPAVSSWSPFRLDIFIQGRDARLYHKYFDYGWSDWELLP